MINFDWIVTDWIATVAIGSLTAFGILGKKILRRSETDIDTTAYWPWKTLELRIIFPDLFSDCQVMIEICEPFSSLLTSMRV